MDGVGSSSARASRCVELGSGNCDTFRRRYCNVTYELIMISINERDIGDLVHMEADGGDFQDVDGASWPNLDVDHPLRPRVADIDREP